MTTKEEAAKEGRQRVFGDMKGGCVYGGESFAYEDGIKVGADWRAENPDWKDPEKDGGPEEGDLCVCYWAPKDGGDSLCMDVRFWHAIPEEIEASDLILQRWLLIERAK